MMAERYREHCNHPVTESYEIKKWTGHHHRAKYDLRIGVSYGTTSILRSRYKEESIHEMQFQPPALPEDSGGGAGRQLYDRTVQAP